MSATAALSAAFYLCLFIGMGLNLFAMLRYSQGRPLARRMRLRLAIVGVAVLLIGGGLGLTGLLLS